MKKQHFLLFLLLAVFVFNGCQPDSTDDVTPTTQEINFVGFWNRDSVIVYEIESGTKTRTDEVANAGTYTFSSDKQTGYLNISGSDYAITWNYNSSANTIRISEPDWMSQLYEIKELSTVKLILTGYRDAGSGIQEQRVIYLTKK